VLVIPAAVSEGSRVIDVIPLSPTVEVIAWSRGLPDALAGRCTAIQLGDSLLLMAAVGCEKNDIFRQLARPITGRGGDTPGAQPKLAPELAPDSGDDTPRLYSRVTLAHALVDHDYTSEPNDALVAIEIRSGTSLTRVGIRKPWLERGVILGRAEEKCSHVALAKALSSDEVSRCHAYFRLEGDDVVFYDTASIAGLMVNDQPVRRFTVPAPRNAFDAGVPRDVRTSLVNPDRVWISLTDDTQITLLAVEAH
jgi:hypothetical protein